MFTRLCTAFLFSLVLYAQEEDIQRSEDVTLDIGEAYEVPTKEGTTLHISRRGIVDAQLLPSRLRIVGVKKGLVVLTLTQNQSEEDFKYFITVKEEEHLPKSFDDLKNLCEGAGLFFNDKTQEVQGTSSQYILFYRIKQLCESRKPCSFAASLSQSGKSFLEDSLKKSLGSERELLVQSNGSILVLVACNEKSDEKEQSKILKHLSGSKLIEDNLLIACKKDWHGGYFTLYAKMIVMETSTAKDIGLQNTLELGKTLNTLSSASSLELSLHAALKEKKAKLIGEPVIWMVDGVEARAQSGSEILVLRENANGKNRHAKYAWKEIGLDLKVKLFTLDAEKVRLQYSFLISNPSKDATQIHRNKLESEVELSLENAAVVGGIQFSTSLDSTDRVPILDSIPIFGPLLRRSGESENGSSIFLYFYLSKS